MSSAEHVIESLLYYMSRGEDPDEIVKRRPMPENLKDANMTKDTAIRIASLVFSLYGEYPPCFKENVQNSDEFMESYMNTDRGTQFTIQELQEAINKLRSKK